MSHEQVLKARAARETYLGNPNVKRDGVNEEWTQETLLEYSIFLLGAAGTRVECEENQRERWQ